MQILLPLTALYAVLVGLQIGRNLWFDELLTLHIAQQPSLSRLIHLDRVWDLNPPILHLLAHFCLWLTNGNPLAVRIPSVVEFYLASVFLFLYGSRKMGRTFAALPVILLWYSPIFSFATEARPYAALCFWFCALLISWDTAVTRREKRGWAIAGVAFAAAGLLTTHVLAPLSLLPFLLAEAIRYRGRRVADKALWAALVLPLALTLLYIPFFSNFGSITEYPPAFQAGFEKLASFYWHTSLDVLACAVLAVIAAFVAERIWRSSSDASPPTPTQPPEASLWIALLCVPVLLDIVMRAQHAPFWGRYCITTAVGMYFLCGWLIAHLFRGRRCAGYSAVAAGALLLLVHGVAIPAYRGIVHPAPHQFAGIEAIHPDLPLVAASGLTFGEMGAYENSDTRARLYYLLDRQAASKYAHATMFEDLEGYQAAFQLPGTVEAYSRFIGDHKHFLVIGSLSYPEDWLLNKLAADGAQIRPLGQYVTPYKDKWLFDVRVQ